MHVLWITESADFSGGAERLIADSVGLLAERGVFSTLLYRSLRKMSPDFTGRFQGAFPWVDFRRQMEDIDPDLIFVHQLRGIGAIRSIAGSGVPVLRFFHDHDLFCLRGHKYTTLCHRTCRRAAGLRCYPCLGMLNRTKGWPGFRLASLGGLRREQRENRKFDGFIVASEYMKEHLVLHGFRPSSVHVVPLFVSPPDGEPAGRREPGRLLFVGSLVRGKGLDILLEAMKALEPEIRLTVVGGGRQESWFRRMRDSLGLDSRVEFVGPLQRSELDGLYGKATCVVVPSREPETFCLVGPEAFRHGTPVVASDVGGMDEWLKDGETGLSFSSGDPTALTVALRSVLEDEERATALGACGRELVRERFLPERHVDGLLAIMDSVLNRRGVNP